MSQEVVTRRLKGLDALKGLLTLKMAAAHIAPAFGIAFLWPFHIFSAFTFSTLLFCFGTGIGMSSKRRTARQALPLMGLYWLAGIVGAAAGALRTPSEAAMKMSFITSVHDVPKGLMLSGFGPGYLVPFIVFSLVALWVHRPDCRMNVFRYVLLFTMSLIVAVFGNLLDTLWPSGPLAGLYGFGFRTFQSAPIVMCGYLLGRYLRDGGKLPNLNKRETWQFGSALAGLLMVNQFTNAWMKGTTVQWKETGRLGYSLMGALVACLLFAAFEMLARRWDGKMVDFFSRVGRRTVISLGLQFGTMPVVALVALQTESQVAKAVIGFVYVGLMAVWLSRPSVKKVVAADALGADGLILEPSDRIPLAEAGFATIGRTG